jgi:hypothetical protein
MTTGAAERPGFVRDALGAALRKCAKIRLAAEAGGRAGQDEHAAPGGSQTPLLRRRAPTRDTLGCKTPAQRGRGRDLRQRARRGVCARQFLRHLWSRSGPPRHDQVCD